LQKVMLVMFVFPVVVEVVDVGLGLSLTLGVLQLPPAMQPIAIRGVQWFALVTGLVCAFFACRSFWPKPARPTILEPPSAS
ncbi:MAG TPA: hypothetical protein VMW27_22210, partial [Thermoanaerobaculia bacterium]|nr:hypothetical protein [Thermoanaerobaculia bacterium]